MCQTSHNQQWKDEAEITESHVKTLNEIRETVPELNFPRDGSIFKMRTVNLFTIRIGDRQEMTTEATKSGLWILARSIFS